MIHASVSCDGVVGMRFFDLAVEAEVTKSDVSGTDLERLAIESDSLVRENIPIFRARFLSTAGHEKPCGNLGGPSSKAKYSLVTDSEPVP